MLVAAMAVVGRVARCRVTATQPRVGWRHLSKTAGLVGLANVGKSTLFNALVRNQLALAANYPFATIEPNVALVPVPDPRLATLAALSQSARAISWQMEYHDIAGLIKGASKGEGLGNAFLANIRSVNAIIQVVRCFDSADIIHVETTPDAVRDISIVETELALADLQSIDKRLAGLSGKGARHPDAALTADLLRRAAAVLNEGKPARVLEAQIQPRELATWRSLQLLTQKPVLYVCNVDESAAAAGGNPAVEAVRAFLAAQAPSGAPPPFMATVCAQLEAEAALLPDVEREELLREYGLASSGLDGLMAETARLLGLQVFYTTGPSESRAWPVPAGCTAVEAASTIHSDFGPAFIKAEITAYDAFVAAGGEAGAKAANKTRNEGKEYVMVDGDVAVFKIGPIKAAGH